MRRKTTLLLLLFALVATSACADGTGLVRHGAFIARAYAGTLVLRNDAPAPAHYAAVSRDLAPLVELALPKDWPAVGPNASKTLGYEDVIGYETGTQEVLVYWWRSDADQGSVIVQLP